jgi:hypothetical protein
MVNLIEEKEAFDKLIRVLEDAIEAAAKILGPNARPALRSHYRILENASQVYEDLSDLLDAARAGRSRLLEQSN